MDQINRNVLYKSFFIIWIGHLLLDFMTGIWPVYKTLAHLDLAKAGFIAGIALFLGELSQLAFGFLSVRGYHKKLIIVGILMASSISFLAYSDNYLILFLMMLITYLGAGAFHPAAAGMVGSWSGGRKGLFLALFSSGGLAGSALSQRVFSKTFELFNGHTLIFLLPAAGLGLLFYFNSFPPFKFCEKKITLKRILKWIKPKRKDLITLYFAQVFIQCVNWSFIFLLPDILFLRKYESWFCLGGAHFCFVIGSALMSVPAGVLADRYSIRNVLIVVVLMSVLGFYIFLLSGTLAVLPTSLLLFCMGGTMGVLNPIIVAAGNGMVPISASSIISASLMGGATCIAGFGIMLAGFMTTLFTHEPPIQALQVIGSIYVAVIFLIFQLSQEGELKT
ncbi:MAG: MFS transporter, partial [Bacteroidetes bacterium]|nr:MFS transporter [Bacteroidota bacterium]